MSACDGRPGKMTNDKSDYISDPAFKYL